MAFPPAFLDELNARNPIEDVVGQYVALTRRGSNLFGLCPFHGEKTPSFSVAPEKGIFYCFGCHKGGGVVNFIMEIENLTYGDAVRFLAKRAASRSRTMALISRSIRKKNGSGHCAARRRSSITPSSRPRRERRRGPICRSAVSPARRSHASASAIRRIAGRLCSTS